MIDQNLRIVRPADLARLLNVSRPTLWRMRQRGELPEPLRLSAGAIGWRVATINQWLVRREEEAAGRRTVSERAQ